MNREQYMCKLDTLRFGQGMCAFMRPQGRFGIAVSKDPPAVKWQALNDKVLKLYAKARVEDG